MSDTAFKNDPSKLPQNVTGWIELTDELRDEYPFHHGDVWLMAVPVCDRRVPRLWEYELSVVTVDCDGPLQLECNDVPWGWELENVAYMAPLRT